jgi:hypothetical protein
MQCTAGGGLLRLLSIIIFFAPQWEVPTMLVEAVTPRDYFQFFSELGNIAIEIFHYHQYYK